MRKIVSALALAAAAVATPASAVVVGGIDFGALGNTAHIETATLAETLVTGVGQNLQGYGLVTTVNGLAGNAYCASPPCSLYYYFHDYTSTYFDPSHVKFTGGIVDLYYAPVAAADLFTQNSVANVALIQSFTPWARLVGHTFSDPLFLPLLPTQTLNGFGTLTGGTLTETGQGQLDVTGGFGIAAVTAYLNGNSIADNLGGFADIVVTSSSNNFVLNPNDVSGGLANGCSNGTAAAGAWCLQGTLNTRGATAIPEPGTLALVGLAFVGVGLSRRRKSEVK